MLRLEEEKRRRQKGRDETKVHKLNHSKQSSHRTGTRESENFPGERNSGVISPVQCVVFLLLKSAIILIE